LAPTGVAIFCFTISHQAALIEPIDDFSVSNLGAGPDDDIAQISLPAWQGLIAIADAAF
jgi:hypothetical protein